MDPNGELRVLFHVTLLNHTTVCFYYYGGISALRPHGPFLPFIIPCIRIFSIYPDFFFFSVI